MKIVTYFFGACKNKRFEPLIDIYCEKVKHFISFQIEIIKDVKAKKEQKEVEGQVLLKKFQPTDFVVLLDNNGQKLDSPGFAKFIEHKMTNHPFNLVFVVGGAYGFSKAVYARADALLSLSPMTFTHDMVRIIFMEQLYRAFSIIRNLPYHHK